MESDNNILYELIDNLEWHLNMGVEAMVEEKNNNYSNIGKNKINKGDNLKLKSPQKSDTSHLKEEELDQDTTLKESIKNCLNLERNNIQKICEIIQTRTVNKQQLKMFLGKEMVPQWDHNLKIRKRLLKQAG